MPIPWDGLITFFGTDNLEATHHFYHQMLELPLYKDQGLCRIYEVPGGGKLGFCTHVPVLCEEKTPIITLLTPEVDKVWQQLKEFGLHPQLPQETSRFKIYHFFLTDPNGYCVEIQRFLD